MRYYLIDNQGRTQAESQTRETLEMIKSMFEAEFEDDAKRLELEIIESY